MNPAFSCLRVRGVRAGRDVGWIASVLSLFFALAASAAPTLVSTASVDGATVGLCFAGDLDRSTAEDPARYAIAGATVQNATLLADNRTVLLAVTGLSGQSYTVSGTDLKDAGGQVGSVSGTGPVLGLTVEDIGNLLEPSRVYACGPDSISIHQSGGAIWFSADACNLVHREQTGDFDVRVQVAQVAGGTLNSNLTIDARESADPDSRHVFVAVYGSVQNKWAAARRLETAGPSSVFDGSWGVAWPAGFDFPNVWMRLKRAGETFTAYGSTNGMDWVQVGDAFTPDPPYPSTIRLGLATAVTDAGAPPLDVEYRNFGTFALTGATILITAQPQDATVVENRAATFSVGAEVQNGSASVLSYQWQRDGGDIPGATQASYTLSPATMLDNGALFRVRITGPGLDPVLSDPAMLRVQRDTDAPKVVSTAGIKGYNVGVCFDEPLDAAAAGDASHYTLDAGVAVEGATLLADQRTVVLQTSGLVSSAYQLQIQGVPDVAGNPATLTVTGQVLDLVVQDLGNLPEPSLVYACSPESVVVRESGGAIWFSADACNFVHQERTGDFDVRVQVNRVVGGNAASNLALDVRESTDPDSRHVFAAAYAHDQRAWAAARRVETAGPSSVLDGNWLVAWPAGFDFPNIWLRLKRSGNTFTAYGSTNGLDWLQAGNAFTPDPPYPASTRVGLATAVTSGTGAMEVEYRSFGDFKLSDTTIQLVTQPQSLTVVENRSATFSVQANLLNGPQGALSYQWQRDGGDIEGAVAASYSLPLVTLADNNARFRVRVSAPGAVSVLSEAATLTVLADVQGPKALSGYAMVSTMVGVCFDEVLDPVSASDPSRYSLGAGVTIEGAELQSEGRTVVLRVSGLAGASATLTATDIADLKGNPGTSTVTVANGGLEYVDVGDVTEPGLLISCEPDRFQLRAGGADIWGAQDSFGFVYESLSGDFDLRLQMSDIRGGNACTRGGLMVREEPTPGSRNLFVGTYPTTGDNHWVATYRTEAGANTLILPGGAYRLREADFAYPNVWFRLTRTGETFTTYYSTNGVDWVQLGSKVTPAPAYPNPVLVGIAASSIFNCGAPPSALFSYQNYGPTPVVVPPPTLAIARVGVDVQLSWPANAEGFKLQSASVLGAGDWTQVSTAPVGVGDRNVVTEPIAPGTRFYRLAR